MLHPTSPTVFIPADKGRSQPLRPGTRSGTLPGSVGRKRIAATPSAPPQFSGARAGRQESPSWVENRWEQYLRWRNRLNTLIKASWEKYFNRFKSRVSQGFLALAAIMGTMPFPQFILNRLNRRFFFSPRKVTSKELLRSETLRKSMSLHIFYADPEKMNELYAWHIEAEPGKPTVLFSHGRDCNISHLEPIMQGLKNKGFGVFVYDYPGFGKSEGQPGEQALYKAGLAASKYLAGKSEVMKSSCSVPYRDQIIMGHSLGGAVAVDVARRLSLDGEKTDLPRALALINTFTDIKEPFREQLDRMPRLIRSMFSMDSIPFEFDSKNKIADVKMPVLILHGSQDTTISCKQGRDLYDAAIKGKAGKYSFQEVRGARHGLHPELCRTVADSLEKFLENKISCVV